MANAIDTYWYSAGEHRILHVAHRRLTVVAGLRLAGAVLLDPARLVRKTALAQQLCAVQRHGVGVAQLVVGPLVLPVGDALIAWPGADGLQARRFRRPAQCQEHQRDQKHHPQRRQDRGATDHRVPAHRTADDIRQRRAQKVGAAGAITVIGGAQIAGQPPRRDVGAIRLGDGHGGGGGPGSGAPGGGGRSCRSRRAPWSAARSGS